VNIEAKNKAKSLSLSIHCCNIVASSRMINQKRVEEVKSEGGGENVRLRRDRGTNANIVQYILA